MQEHAHTQGLQRLIQAAYNGGVCVRHFRRLHVLFIWKWQSGSYKQLQPHVPTAQGHINILGMSVMEYYYSVLQ